MSDQIKFEVTCDQAFAQALDSLSSRLGKTRSDTIRDALNFYENAVNEWERSKGAAKGNKQEEQ
jgi:metal-responsive CopG/Arc/MetJ family transcriptional regulator